jgi:transcriptional regulator with XRE-family HTH domain
MPLTAAEKIKIILRRKNMTSGQLADILGQTRQNLSNKMSRDNFSEKELREIAAALGCEIEVKFTMTETGETV